MILQKLHTSMGCRVKARVLEPISPRDLSRRGVVDMNRNGVLCLGRIVSETPWAHNLVTNYGLNRLCTDNGVAAQMTYACAGFDGTGTEYAVSADVSQSGFIVTGPTGTFSGTEVGEVIAWDSDPNGTQATVLDRIDSETLEVSKSQTVASGPAKIYNVSFSTLFSERSAANSLTPFRTNSYLVGENGTIHTPGSSDYVLWRTYDFTPQTTDVIYREVGLSNSSAQGSSTLFNRIRLPGDVNVLNDQQLRLVVEMFVRVSPAGATMAAPTITGWGTVAGMQSLVAGAVAGIQTTGASVSLAGGTTNTDSAFPYRNAASPGVVKGWVSETATALGAYETIVNRNDSPVVASSLTVGGYLTDSFFRDLQAVFTPAQGNFTCRSFGFGGEWGGSGSFLPHNTGQWLTFVADADQSKLDTHRLTLNFRRSVGRFLVAP